MELLAIWLGTPMAGMSVSRSCSEQSKTLSSVPGGVAFVPLALRNNNQLYFISLVLTLVKNIFCTLTLTLTLTLTYLHVYKTTTMTKSLDYLTIKIIYIFYNNKIMPSLSIFVLHFSFQKLRHIVRSKFYDQNSPLQFLFDYFILIFVRGQNFTNFFLVSLI